MMAARALQVSEKMKEQVISKPLNNELAGLNRDSICKALYEGLFNWVVRRINRELFGPEVVRQPNQRCHARPSLLA